MIFCPRDQSYTTGRSEKSVRKCEKSATVRTRIARGNPTDKIILDFLVKEKQEKRQQLTKIYFKDYSILYFLFAFIVTY